jgi:methionine synthase II (cobalamin-independent)
MANTGAIVCSSLALTCFAFAEAVWAVFWGTFFPGMEGFEEIKNPDIDIFRMYMPDIAAFTETGHKPGESVICTGKIKHVGSTYVEQWKYLKSIVPKERIAECKITMAAPEWYHMRYKEGRAYPKDIYTSDAEYFADIAKAYQTELQTSTTTA